MSAARAVISLSKRSAGGDLPAENTLQRELTLLLRAPWIALSVLQVAIRTQQRRIRRLPDGTRLRMQLHKRSSSRGS